MLSGSQEKVLKGVVLLPLVGALPFFLCRVVENSWAVQAPPAGGFVDRPLVRLLRKRVVLARAPVPGTIATHLETGASQKLAVGCGHRIVRVGIERVDGSATVGMHAVRRT